MKASETIFDGLEHVIAMADVAFVEKRPNGALVIMKQTYWSSEAGEWANACYLPQVEYEQFVRSYGRYRNEIDAPLELREGAQPR